LFEAEVGQGWEIPLAGNWADIVRRRGLLGCRRAGRRWGFDGRDTDRLLARGCGGRVEVVGGGWGAIDGGGLDSFGDLDRDGGSHASI
jgi:hypothetical protein